MPLEFALRPRINLERPPPRRRLSRLRLPSFALPLGIYWLALAGVTHALIRSATADASEKAGPEEMAGSAPAVDAEQKVLLAPSTSSSTALNGGTLAAPSTSALATPNADPTVLGAGAAELGPEPDSETPPGTEPEPQQPSRALSLETRSRSLGRADKSLLPREQAPHEQAPREQAPRDVPRLAYQETTPKEQPKAPEPVQERARRRSEALKEVDQEKTPRDEAATTSLPSCESAAASANQSVDLRAGRGAPDLTRNAFAAVLDNGAYFSHCALSPRTALEICAAVQDGKVVGVSVTTEPRNTAINACVRGAVARLRFPRSSQLDITRTRFEPAL